MALPDRILSMPTAPLYDHLATLRGLMAHARFTRLALADAAGIAAELKRRAVAAHPDGRFVANHFRVPFPARNPDRIVSVSPADFDTLAALYSECNR